MPSASTAGVNLHHLQRCCTAWFVCLLISAPATQADKRVYQALVVSATLCNGGEDIIKGALHSVVNWVDLCILLDTGITDNTLQVAKEVAGDKLLVRNLPWPDSFAAARNAALDAAATTGAQWALILDADERILLGPHSTVRDHILNSSADMVNMLHDSLTYHKPRFFRLPRAGSFHGRTHEYFSLSHGAVQHTLDSTARFAELAKDEAAVRHKALRDIQLLTQETAAAPQEQRWWYYLGDAYEIAGDCRSAIMAWATCVGLRHGWDEEGAWCMYRAAMCHANERSWDQALEALARGMTRHPGLPELPWYAGWVAYQAGQYAQAKAWSQVSIALGCYTGLCMDRTGFSHPQGKYEGPFDVLSWALRALGDQQAAEQAAQEHSKAVAARTAPGAK